MRGRGCAVAAARRNSVFRVAKLPAGAGHNDINAIARTCRTADPACLEPASPGRAVAHSRFALWVCAGRRLSRGSRYCGVLTRFGVQLPSFSGFDPADLFEHVAGLATTAEEAGFDSVRVMDHFFQLPPLGGPDQPMLEAYTLLGALAARTRRGQPGTLVTGVTYRNPGILAKIIATLDVISRGRAILGIGGAWYTTLSTRVPASAIRGPGAPGHARGGGPGLPGHVHRRRCELLRHSLPARSRPQPAPARAGRRAEDHDRRRRRREEDAAAGGPLRGHVQRDGRRQHGWPARSACCIATAPRPAGIQPRGAGG